LTAGVNSISHTRAIRVFIWNELSFIEVNKHLVDLFAVGLEVGG
jgi:hypothetical protein